MREAVGIARPIRHQDGEDILRPERLRRERHDERRVDAAAHADDAAPDAELADLLGDKLRQDAPVRSGSIQSAPRRPSDRVDRRPLVCSIACAIVARPLIVHCFTSHAIESIACLLRGEQSLCRRTRDPPACLLAQKVGQLHERCRRGDRHRRVEVREVHGEGRWCVHRSPMVRPLSAPTRLTERRERSGRWRGCH